MSTTPINDGGPAFPVPGMTGLPNGEFIHAHPGMSVRDWFAGQALAALIGHEGKDGRNTRGPASVPVLPRFAYEFADAMLAERAKAQVQSEPAPEADGELNYRDPGFY